jgi:hypothetical protein
LLLGSAAFAEDGFKAYLGYYGGYENGKTSNYNSDAFAGSSTVTRFIHGPSGDIRYEGQLFVRGTFDYLMGASDKVKYDTGANNNTKFYKWEAEGDIGYRIYNSNNIGITPYIGGGYMEQKFTDKISTDSWSKFYAPFGVAGGIIKYEQLQWSVALDAAALAPFVGKFKTLNMSVDQRVGIGGRAQLPITYTLMQKKANGVGIVLFVTPVYEYLDTFKSKADSLTNKAKLRNYTAGGKAGIGFVF